MTCKFCLSNPIYKLPNKSLCQRCFIEYFENKVFKTIKKYSLIDFNDTLAVAVSGEKDSILVLYMIKKFLKKQNWHNKIVALLIDEGIKGYRDTKIPYLKQFCLDLNIDLQVVKYSEEFGITMDQVTKKIKNTNVSHCNICGTFRRSLLNKYALKIGANKLVTGHNLDDEAATTLLNLFKNNSNILKRIGYKSNIVDRKRLVPRIKPLYFMKEEEIVLYAKFKNLLYVKEYCPYSQGSFRRELLTFIDHFEKEIGGVKSSIVKSFLKINKELPKKLKEDNKIKVCSICGNVSNSEVCNVCKYLQWIKNLK